MASMRFNEIAQAGTLADGDGETDLRPAADGDHGVGVETAVGPHRELSPGSTVAHPPQRLTQEVGGAAGGVGAALAQPGHRHVAGSGAGGPGPDQQFRAHPVQLADVAPANAAQEGTQRGWRLDRAAQGAGRTSSAQHVGVVDTVAASQRGGQQRHHLIAGVGSAWRIAQVEAPVNQLGHAEMLGQGGRQEQTGIGHQAVIVEGDADEVGVVAW